MIEPKKKIIPKKVAKKKVTKKKITKKKVTRKKPTLAKLYAKKQHDEMVRMQEAFIKSYSAKACNVTEACKSISISRMTYYKWMNNTDGFAEKIDDAKHGLHDFVESSLLLLIKKGNIAATIFYCKTQLKHRGYIERVEQQSFEHVPDDITEAKLDEQRKKYFDELENEKIDKQRAEYKAELEKEK